MPAFEYDSLTTVNTPMIRFPMITGLTIAGATPSTVDIPMVVTSYTPVSRGATVGVLGSIPIIDEGFSYGGQTVAVGNIALPKLSVEGFMDTPTVASGAYQLPDILLSSIRLTYGELIAMYFEGRAASSGWGRVDPTWFRDPYGRVYNSPYIMDFSATYVQAVPGRTNFTLQLKV